jgi:hypothetical protein
MSFKKLSAQYRLYLLMLIAALPIACKQKPVKKGLSFNPITSIGYTEVRRRLANGLSFDNQGFEVEPSWKVTFLGNDSASVWSPDKQKFLNFLVSVDHDSIFNVARSWFRLQHMDKDSLKLQVLQVEGDTIYWLRSKVYMTLYANNYLKNLKINPLMLEKPSRADTLFIKAKAGLANKNIDSAFAAREPVVLKSINPNLSVEKVGVQAGMMNNFDASEGYLDPEFNITINKAYQNFSYSFTVYVDGGGQMHFGRSVNYIMPEFKAATISVMKGIINGYLKTYMAVTPGKTLGIAHTSLITLNVVGRKG